jgi:hypothetical protein
MNNASRRPSYMWCGEHGTKGCGSAHRASAPISSSMRRSWLYFAVRSPRHGAPALIWPQLNPTARSAIKLSSVSPERCEHITPHPATLAILTASIASVIVPI